LAKNNKKLQNSFAYGADLSKYSEDLIDLEDDAEEYYGPSRVKNKKKQHYD
jgi:hypothetical protein